MSVGVFNNLKMCMSVLEANTPPFCDEFLILRVQFLTIG